MIQNFWEKEKTLIAFTGSITAIAGLFLNITTPQNKAAISALVNIQVFWLVIVVVCLCKLFFSFLREIIEIDKRLKTFYIFSISVGYVFLWIIINLLNYIVNFNNQYSSFLIGIIVLFGMLGLCVWLPIWVDKHNKFSILSKGVVWSFSMSAIIVLLGTAIENWIVKFISFFWFYGVLPISFVICLAIFIGICIYNKLKLSQP